jgi:hypothetical protein
VNVGCSWTVFELPGWPPPQKVRLFQHERVSVYGWPDGHFSLELRSEDGSEQLQHETQPVRFEGTVRFVLGVSWEAPKVEVRVNARPLQSRTETAESFIVADGVQPVPAQPVATEHPDAANACKTWIAWRESHLKPPRAAREGRVLVSGDEQVAQLRGELEFLFSLVAGVRAGRLALLPKVAGSLRGLLYWEERKDGRLSPSYNPLLLRIAARADFPLPVYAQPDQRPPALGGPTSIVLTNLAMLRPVYPNQILMDVQEWLGLPFGLKRTTSPPAEEVLTAKDVIGQAANTLGGAHFDEDVPKHLDELRRLLTLGVDAVTSFLVLTAGTVVELGRFTLSKLLT